MPPLVELCNQEPLEVPYEDANNGQVAPEDPPLTTIVHYFVSLVATDSQVWVTPVANMLDLF